MRILHCCLSCFYIDGYNYQENILPKINKLDGHEVMVIASTETYIDNNNLGYIEPCEYYTCDNVLIKRIAYAWSFNKTLQRKLRFYKDLLPIISDFAPDVILFHGLCAGALLDAAKYKLQHPEVKFYADSHEDFHNSAKNWLSRNVLYKFIYNHYLRKALPYIDKIFYITYETKLFDQEMYGISEEQLEFYPLGGIICPADERLQRRLNIRKALHLSTDDILLVHSGKMVAKKRTYELLEAFCAIDATNLKLVILGSMTDDVSSRVMPLIEQDPRVEYLGWKSGDELMDYLCAADLYVQPGTQSATMQNALCCGSAAALFPYPSHKFLLGDSVFYIDTVEDMKKLFTEISQNREILEEKRKMSDKIAKEKLDYKVLAARLYR